MNVKKFVWSVIYWGLLIVLLLDDGHISPIPGGALEVGMYITYLPNWIMLIVALISLIATDRIVDFCMGFRNAYSKVPRNVEKSEKAWKQFYITLTILAVMVAFVCLYYCFIIEAGSYLSAILNAANMDKSVKLSINMFTAFNRTNRVIAFGFTILAFLLPVRWNLSK